MTTRNLFAAMIFVGCACSLHAQERFRPGNWEIVFTGDNPHTSTTCFTAAMIQGINGTPDAVRADTDNTAAKRKYKVENYKFDGTTLSYTAVGSERTFVNTASYHGDTFESLIITKAGGKEFTTRQKGRRLGACP
jgi:uncharacterized protein DUF3617